MPNELNPKDPRNLWQSQEGENVTISLEEVRRWAARFERRIWWRNFREYAAGVFVIVWILVSLPFLHGLDLLGPVLMVAGVIYVMIQLRRRGTARSLPADAGARASIEFHRLELERQRDALRTVWRWYLSPLVPGMAAIFAVAAIKRGVNARLIGTIIVGVLVFVGTWALNQWGARKLNRKIQELHRMEGSDGS
jgi:hypothetical protein